MNVIMTFSNQSSILIHSLSFAGHANFTFIEGRNVENACCQYKGVYSEVEGLIKNYSFLNSIVKSK